MVLVYQKVLVYLVYIRRCLISLGACILVDVYISGAKRFERRGTCMSKSTKMLES